jgi:hypothetical protein
MRFEVVEGELAPVRKMQERLWSAFFVRAAPATVPATPAD